MHLCFVDESFRGGFYGYAAVIADEQATKELTDALNRIVSQAIVDWGLPRTTEIHGYPIFHAKDDWVGVPTRARVGIYERVIDAILAADVTILLRSINADRLRERQARENYRVDFPPEQVCFQHILQRANTVAKRAGTYSLIIADDRNDRERHRERFAMYQTEGTPGAYMHTKLDRLLDTIHFAPSHRSRMLQAADMLVFTYHRCRTVEESDARAAMVMDRMWNKIATSPRMYDLGDWP